MNIHPFKTCLVFIFLMWTPLAGAIEPPPVLDPEAVGVNPQIQDLYDAFFPVQIIKATEGVYVARGYNRDNPVLIEGNKGLIVVDPGESKTAAEVVKIAFNNHLDHIFDRKPVKAIIYTHHHDCHIHGASVFADKNTQVIAHENLLNILFYDWFGQVYPTRNVGGAKMSGSLFANNEDWFYGGALFARQIHGDSGFLPPTKTVKDSLKTEIAGVKIHLFSVPGETRDVLVIWLPEMETMVQIANMYEAMPAFTTLRGAYPRDPLSYVSSIDFYRTLNPECLVLPHGPHPVMTGKDNISRTFTNYRDAIQFIHDQTVQGMNKGLTPGEISDLVKLPDHLASDPFLQEIYGDVERNIHEIFYWYRGTFTDKCRDLFPRSPLEDAEMAAELAGGIDELADKAEGAMASGKVEWALTLADDVLLLDPDHAAARKTKNDALIALAESTLNVQKRNYLLSEYLMETDQGGSLGDKLAAISVNPKLAYAGISDNFVELMPLHVANRILAVSLNASESLEKDMIAGVQLTDVPKKSKTESAYYDLHVRKGILEVSEQNPSNGEFIIVTDKLAWKSLVLGKMTPQYAVENEYVTIADADPEKFYAFMALFD